MANNLSGISYTNNFNNLDGLSIVQADELFIDGTSLNPDNLLPYVGSTKTTDLGSQNIKTSRVPTANSDLTNKLYVDGAISVGSGDTLGIVNLNFVRYSGSISDTDLGTYKISSSAVPTTGINLTNKTYVDAQDALRVPYTGATTTVDIGSQNITTTRVPLANPDLTNKLYVDTQDATKASLTGNNTLSGTNSFTNTVSMTPATATATFSLGLNGSNQIVKFTPSSGIGGSITTGYIPYASAANTLADSIIYTSGTNIGIGTTSPAGRFTIYATSATDADRLTSLVINTYRAGIRLTSSATAGCDWNMYVEASGGSPPQDALCFYNQGTSQFRMVITRDGIVSVGKDNVSPVVSSILQSGTSPTDAPYASATLFGGSNPYYKAQICAFNTGGQALYLGSFYTSTVGQIAVIQSSSIYSGQDHATDLSIQPNGGNVGIGRINPSYKLHVEGNIAGQTFSSLFPALNAGAGSNLVMTAGNGAFGSIEAYNTANTVKLPVCLNAYGGNVAVGTTNATGKLTIGSSTADYTNSLVVNTAWPSITLDGTGTTLRKWSILNGGTGAGIGQGNFGIYDITAGAYRLSIGASGSVGIGIDTPSYKLDVAGNMRVSSGDTSRCVYGPNATWGAYLFVGATPDTAGPSTAQVITTNGNLFLDAGNSNSIYYGYYANSRSVSNQHLFYGGDYRYNAMPQNTSDFSQVCVMNGDRMYRSQAVAHQVVVYASNSWAGGTNLVNAFYRYNGSTSQMIIGRLSYYVSGNTMAYPTIRIASQTTGAVWYFQTNNYTNNGGNHITVPIYAIFNGGYTSTTGWFDILVYNGSGCNTDSNDILDIHVITLPVASY